MLSTSFTFMLTTLIGFCSNLKNIAGKAGKDDTKGVEINLPLKYLSNFNQLKSVVKLALW